jgi:hypothetical protein
MATVVEFGVVRGFILDDPNEGVLDTSELGGVKFEDITPFVRNVEIQRGKNRDLDRYSAGALSIEFNNNQRTFDPQFTTGPYFGDIIPRREVRVTTDSERQFTGVIDDWNFVYTPEGDSLAQIVASDDLTFLARQELTPGTATPQTSGARVNAVLGMASVQWPSGVSVDDGVSILGADVFEGNALEYLQKVETSEQGALFVAKDATLTFKDRLDFTPTSDSLTTFADDGTGIRYDRVSVNFGTELLFNTATVTSIAGTATAINQTSRTLYGVVSVEEDTLLSTTGQLENIADFLVRRYAAPEYRIDAMEINLDTMSPSDKATVLGLELGDVVLIKFTPNNIGNPIEQYGQIIRLDSEITRTRHDMVIGVTSLDWNFLVLDDAVFGILDTNHLAF